MSQALSEFIIGKLSAVQEEVRQHFNARYVSSRINEFGKFTVDICLEKFPNDLDTINQKLEEITSYFGLSKKDLRTKVRHSGTNASLEILDEERKIEICIMA